MKIPSAGLLSFSLVGLAALVLVAIGPPGPRGGGSAPAGTAHPSSVSAGGFTLVSVAAELPIDDEAFPDGPHADVVNANCTSCHSASMALAQPRLSAGQWTAIVGKMRETYKAPVSARDVGDIVAYLTALRGKPVPESAAARRGSQIAGDDVTG